MRCEWELLNENERCRRRPAKDTGFCDEHWKQIVERGKASVRAHSTAPASEAARDRLVEYAFKTVSATYRGAWIAANLDQIIDGLQQIVNIFALSDQEGFSERKVDAMIARIEAGKPAREA